MYLQRIPIYIRNINAEIKRRTRAPKRSGAQFSAHFYSKASNLSLRGFCKALMASSSMSSSKVELPEN